MPYQGRFPFGRHCSQFVQIAVLVGVGACSDTGLTSPPPAPTTTPDTTLFASPIPAGSSTALPFQAGTYRMEVRGTDAVSLATGCPGYSRAGVHALITPIVLRYAGDETWEARPATDAGGSFEIRFSPGPLGPGGPGGGPGVQGQVSGFLADTFPLSSIFPPGARITFQSATLTGGVSQDGRVASGQVYGDVVFSNDEGASVPCGTGTVNWFLAWSPQG
jgi:hypothetical protein